VWFLIATGAVFALVAIHDVAKLPRVPAGAVRRLYACRALVGIVGIAGCLAVPVAVDQMLSPGGNWYGFAALGLPVGGLAIPLFTQFIHARRVVSSLVPDRKEHFRS